MLSNNWEWLWHEGCGPSFPSSPFLQKRCHYLILCHPLVYIISICPNHVYMIIHPSFNFNFYIFDKDDTTYWTLFVIQVFLAIHLYYMKDLKSFFFSNFLYYPHKNNSENKTYDERSYEMLMFCPMHSLIPFMFHKSWEIHLISKVWRRCVFHMVPMWFIEHPSPSSLFKCFVRLIHISFVSNDLFLTFWPL